MTESGICTFVRPVQPLKAYSLIVVTELGIVTLVRPVQPLKAESPMDVTELGIFTLVRPVQSLKAQYPMVVTVSGIVILLRLAHPRNALSCIVSTVSGITTSLSLHLLKFPIFLTVMPLILDGITILPPIFLLLQRQTPLSLTDSIFCTASSALCFSSSCLLRSAS